MKMREEIFWLLENTNNSEVNSQDKEEFNVQQLHQHQSAELWHSKPVPYQPHLAFEMSNSIFRYFSFI